MQPYDYTFKNIKNPTDEAMAGLQQGMILKEQFKQKAYQEELGKMYSPDIDRNAYAQQLIEKYPQYAENTMKKYEVFDQQEKAKVLQQDLATLQNNPNPTAEDYLNFMTKHPTMAKDFETNYNILNKQKKETTLKDATELYAAVSSGNLDLAEKILTTRIEAAQNAGMKKEEDGARALLQLVKTNPNAAKTTTGLFLATAVGGSEAFTSMIKELNTTPEGTYQVLTPKEKKELGLPPEGNYQKSPDGKISLVSTPNIPTDFEKKEQEKKLLKLDLEIKKLTNNGTEELDTEKKFDFEKKLRDEYIGGTKNYIQTKEAYEKINAAEDNAVGDISLIFSYMKMLDPGSVVREGEFATAQNAAGVGDRIRNTYNNVVSGQRLNTEQRNSFKTQAKKLLDASATTEKQVRDRVTRIADNYGLNVENIYFTQPEKPSIVETRILADGSKVHLMSDGTYKEGK